MAEFVFEEAMKRLEQIVQQLEKGDAPLDQSLALFEEGTKLIKACGAALDQADHKLTVLVSAGDKPETAPFQTEA